MDPGGLGGGLSVVSVNIRYIAIAAAVILWTQLGPVAGNERGPSRKIPDARLQTTKTETKSNIVRSSVLSPPPNNPKNILHSQLGEAKAGGPRPIASEGHGMFVEPANGGALFTPRREGGPKG